MKRLLLFICFLPCTVLAQDKPGATTISPAGLTDVYVEPGERPPILTRLELEERAASLSAAYRKPYDAELAFISRGLPPGFYVGAGLLLTAGGAAILSQLPENNGEIATGSVMFFGGPGVLTYGMVKLVQKRKAARRASALYYEDVYGIR